MMLVKLISPDSIFCLSTGNTLQSASGANGLVPLWFGRVYNGRLFARLISNKICIVVLHVNNPMAGLGEGVGGEEGRRTENMGIGVISMAAARVA